MAKKWLELSYDNKRLVLRKYAPHTERERKQYCVTGIKKVRMFLSIVKNSNRHYFTKDGNVYIHYQVEQCPTKNAYEIEPF